MPLLDARSSEPGGSVLPGPPPPAPADVMLPAVPLLVGDATARVDGLPVALREEESLLPGSSLPESPLLESSPLPESPPESPLLESSLPETLESSLPESLSLGSSPESPLLGSSPGSPPLGLSSSSGQLPRSEQGRPFPFPSRLPPFLPGPWLTIFSYFVYSSSLFFSFCYSGYIGNQEAKRVGQSLKRNTARQCRVWNALFV